MNLFTEKFKNEKPVIAMLHMKGDMHLSAMNRAKREIGIFYESGIDAVLVENYFGAARDCEDALKYLKENYPNRHYGVNILGGWKDSFRLAEAYNADFIQIDSVCGHLRPAQDEIYALALNETRKTSRAAVLGGVRFKYQPVKSMRTLEEDLHLGMQRCDAIVVTGEGTGLPTPPQKLFDFRAVVNDFPLIVGAGVTDLTIAQTMKNAEGVIIGSWLKDWHADIGEVNEEYVRTIVNGAK